LNRLGIEYMHERFGRGNVIERFFGYMKKKGGGILQQHK
jgi:hypothetical protein